METATTYSINAPHLTNMTSTRYQHGRTDPVHLDQSDGVRGDAVRGDDERGETRRR
jgi:hypothetical protein